ncbi:hypothetical protein T492DRAFT_1132896, partial [Pavlovales sp. CCMP2436]
QPAGNVTAVLAGDAGEPAGRSVALADGNTPLRTCALGEDDAGVSREGLAAGSSAATEQLEPFGSSSPSPWQRSSSSPLPNSPPQSSMSSHPLSPPPSPPLSPPSSPPSSPLPRTLPRSPPGFPPPPSPPPTPWPSLTAPLPESLTGGFLKTVRHRLLGVAGAGGGGQRGHSSWTVSVDEGAHNTPRSPGAIPRPLGRAQTQVQDEQLGGQAQTLRAQ